MKFVQSEVFSSLKDKVYQRDTTASLPPSVPEVGLMERALALVKSVRLSG